MLRCSSSTSIEGRRNCRKPRTKSIEEYFNLDQAFPPSFFSCSKLAIILQVRYCHSSSVSLPVTKRGSSFHRTLISSSFSQLHANTPHHVQTTHKMFRTALLRSARQAIRVAPRCQTSIARPAARSSLFQSKQITPATYFQAVRCYSASAGLAKAEVEGRIMDLLKNFDKV